MPRSNTGRAAVLHLMGEEGGVTGLVRIYSDRALNDIKRVSESP